MPRNAHTSSTDRYEVNGNVNITISIRQNDVSFLKIILNLEQGLHKKPHK